MMRFEVGNDRGGKPTWWLYAANNKLVAWAGESFSSTYNAQRAASGFKAAAEMARYEVYKDFGGDYRWRAWCESERSPRRESRSPASGPPGPPRRTSATTLVPPPGLRPEVVWAADEHSPPAAHIRHRKHRVSGQTHNLG